MREMKLRDESAQCDFKIEGTDMGPFIIYNLETLAGHFAPQSRPATGPEIALWNELQKRGVKWGDWDGNRDLSLFVRGLTCSCGARLLTIHVGVNPKTRKYRWGFFVKKDSYDSGKTWYDSLPDAQSAAEKAAEEYLKERGMK